MTALKISALLLAALLMSFTPKHNTAVTGNKAILTDKTISIEWKKMEIDLGEITQNKPVTVEFEFKNTGEVPVIISNVQASCGCTATNFSKTPVMPGESTKITATYNAAAKGIFKKTVTVITNAKSTPETLTLSGTVI
jgi:hypothetical protein